MADHDKLRIVVDTNVCIQWLLARDRSDSILTACLKGHFQLLYSTWLLKELAEVIQRPKFRKWFTQDQGEELIDLMIIAGEEIEQRVTEELPRVCRDPNDNFLFAMYEDGQADLIVSGDKDVLSVVLPGVTVVDPATAKTRLSSKHEWGTYLLPESVPGTARKTIAVAGNSKLFDSLELFLACLEEIKRGKFDATQLSMVTAPCTLKGWRKNLDQVQQLIDHRGFSTQPIYISPDIACIKLVPDVGKVVVVVQSPQNLTDIVLITFERCMDLFVNGVDPLGVDGWRAHSIGMRPLQANELRPASDPVRQREAARLRKLWE